MGLIKVSILRVDRAVSRKIWQFATAQLLSFQASEAKWTRLYQMIRAGRGLSPEGEPADALLDPIPPSPFGRINSRLAPACQAKPTIWVRCGC